VFRQEHVQIASLNGTAQPAEARHEHELKLRDDRAGDTHEEIVEAAILEVILDSSAADPADAAIYDDDLAVVDVTELRKVPLPRRSSHNRLRRSPYLRCAHHPDLDTSGQKPLVKGTTRPIRIGTLPIDDEAHRDAFA
jgi:hypothetical protein